MNELERLEKKYNERRKILLETKNCRHVSMFDDFDEYYEEILKRNSESTEDGHMIVFNINEELLEKKKEYFKECFDNHLSPYKALTFMDISMN